LLCALPASFAIQRARCTTVHSRVSPLCRVAGHVDCNAVAACQYRNYRVLESLPGQSPSSNSGRYYHCTGHMQYILYYAVHMGGPTLRKPHRSKLILIQIKSHPRVLPPTASARCPLASATPSPRLHAPPPLPWKRERQPRTRVCTSGNTRCQFDPGRRL